ncbi:MAG: response regulator transcription factor [Oscillospiraceae bacterium]|nr:response regulator transcription factor [Oscillospiraceae bacterium]
MIYCVEDDSAIRELMLYTLRASGFQAEGFERAAEFWEAMGAKEKPELILLDLMLPDEDGIEILKKLRGYVVTEKIPVILATAKGTEYDKVIGLDLGADDYLAKPFGMMEMVSRIRAVLRRTAPEAAPSLLTCGGLEMNETSHQVRVNGAPVELTLKEYALLRLFLQNPGRVFTRDNLLQTVWDSEFVGETRTVDVHIASLRTKLGPAAGCIRTVRGVGYRLEEQL